MAATRYEQALAAHPGDPVRAVEAFFGVRAGAPDAELRSVVRPACATVADTLARTASGGAAHR
ncbi:hypothetical protein [Streptomyces rhizosphaericus]|uniref:Tetratricopeptide repeat protein n=1 Tax=Streptomyces rhizosphaericus TaxID=114699 RepID=A0A6G4ANQ1_9ACTN|nr:hypothetical protein [Streptomyces rhizosphaericus]NEW74870.1 hypothetical protein [Streptomyces rhizosphaericus]